MKNWKKIFILTGIVFLLFVSMSAEAYNTTDEYVEDFEDDSSGQHPTENWFTYAAMDLENANVTNSTYHGGSNSLYLNDTGVGDDKVYFNLTSRAYTSVEFWFKINESGHKDFRFYINDGTQAPTRFDVITGTTNYIVFRNYSTIAWNETILTGTWYRARMTFNYTDNEVRGQLWDASGNHNTSDNDTWLAAYQTGYDITAMQQLYIGGGGASDAMDIYIDDLVLTHTYLYEPQAGSPNYLLVLACIVLALVIILAAFKMGTLDSTFIVLILIAIILVIIAVQTVLQIGAAG